MDSSLPPSTHGTDEEGAKHEDAFENVDVWSVSLAFVICKLCVAFCVDSNYNIYVCLLNYVMQFNYARLFCWWLFEYLILLNA
jgi:hypothetical protein